ncbi:piggyBac transposable element-derived protein 4-like [Oppia nitens]|uniref:piggyBac transposable element-derived protein 4-like n=1 Tax=Oppia nitens TaxID=1686743 RepID=UPI0023DCC807|nr:piggyBac transposable element-derived protein 4-like [Oppia nitens]
MDLNDSSEDDEIYSLVFNSDNNNNNNECDIENSDNSDNENFVSSQINDISDLWECDNCDANDWLPHFDKTPGALIDIPANPTLLFEQYFCDEFLQNILNCSNEYGLKHRDNFELINLNELKIFIGIQILMGLKQIPQEKSHWSNDSLYKTELISNAMTQQRYLTIKRSMHFHNQNSDIATMELNDPLFRVRLLLDHMPKISQLLYQPNKELTVDESLIGFHGKFSQAQYMPNKSHKRGIKFYVLCESSTGFMLNWHCHSTNDKGTESFSEQIVLKLLEHVGEFSGHEVYTDNFYTSIPLAKSLINRNIGITGTIRINRKGLPINFKKPFTNSEKLNKTKRGPIYMRNGKICCVQWFDNKLVTAISTHLTKGEVQKERILSQNITSTINVPNIIRQYTKFMAGVDIYDQKLSYHHYSHRVAFWPQVVWHLITNVSMNNCYVIYKSSTIKPMPSEAFKKQIAIRLINNTEHIHHNVFRNSCVNSKLVSIKSTSRSNVMDCYICFKDQKPRKQTSFMCESCKKPLCAKTMDKSLSCFQKHLGYKIIA